MSKPQLSYTSPDVAVAYRGFMVFKAAKGRHSSIMGYF